MNREYPAHKKALEEGGWLQTGVLIHFWCRDEIHPVSFYVVAFMCYNKIPTIECLRVFGGTDEYPAQVSVDKRVAMRNWKRIFGENKR